MYLSLVIIAALAGCGGEPVCKSGTDVSITVARRDQALDCWRVDDVFGTCDSLEEFLSFPVPMYPNPDARCRPQSFAFTEVSTGDCLYVNSTCEGMLDDPRYADCSLSSFEDCCLYLGPGTVQHQDAYKGCF